MSAQELAVKCDGCGVEQYPAILMNEKFAMKPSCPACGREHTFSVNEMTQTPIVSDKPKTAKVVPIRETPSIGPGTDVVEMIRARLQVLDAEISKLAGYAAERKKLVKMLSAAEKVK